MVNDVVQNVTDEAIRAKSASDIVEMRIDFDPVVDVIHHQQISAKKWFVG